MRRLLTNDELKHRVKILIYKTLIRSKATYASTIWCKRRMKKNRERICIMERVAFRYATGLGYDYVKVKNVSNKVLYQNKS